MKKENLFDFLDLLDFLKSLTSRELCELLVHTVVWIGIEYSIYVLVVLPILDSVYYLLPILNSLPPFITLRLLPTGAGLSLAFFVLAPLSVRFRKDRCWHWLGHYEYISCQFSEIAAKGTKWLITYCPKHWGATNTAEECQNANTCEGIGGVDIFLDIPRLPNQGFCDTR